MTELLEAQGLPEEEIARRFSDLWAYFKEKQGNALPLPLAVMAANFMPQIPKVLADRERQKEILDFLALFAWVLGYYAVFSFEESMDKPE